MAAFWKLIERRLSGHVCIGPMTIFGANGMHWAVNIRTRKFGFICFRLPLPCFGRWWPLYLYLSPNATPWASTWIIGDPDGCPNDWNLRVGSKLRRVVLGHGFDTETSEQTMRAIALIEHAIRADERFRERRNNDG